MPRGRAAHHHDDPQNCGMQRLVQPRHALVGAIDGEAILNQVVGADREKIDFPRQQIRGVRRGRNLDHDADRHDGRRRATARQLRGRFPDQAPGLAQLLDARDERKHDPQLALGALERRAQQRAQLHLKRLRPREAQPQAAQALTAGALLGGGPAAPQRLPCQLRRELVLVDVERPDGDRFRGHAFEHAAINLVLFVLADRGAGRPA